MRFAVELLVVLVPLCVAVWFATRAYNRRVRARSLPDPAETPWVLDEYSDGELVVVVCKRPGDEPLLVGSAPWAASDFSDRIEEIRSDAAFKLAALNSGRHLPR